MSYMFYFDQTRCTGCQACIAACKDWNGLKPGPVSYRKIESVEVDGKGLYDFKVKNFTHGCHHCENPGCVKACPSGAIKKDAETGMVIIDRNVCKGEQACLGACPYGNIYIADDAQEPVKEQGWQTRHPAQKCTMCWDRVAESKKPSCVAACPQRALDFGTKEYLEKEYGKKGALVQELKELLTYEDTKPSILCKPK